MPSVSSAKRKLEKWITEEAKTAIDEEVEDIKREIESGRIKELNKRKIINRLKSVMQDKIDELVSEASEASEVLSEGKMLKLGNTFYPASSLEREPLPTTLILPVLPAIAAVLSSKVITAIGATVAAGLGGYIIHDSWDDIKEVFTESTEKEEEAGYGREEEYERYRKEEQYKREIFGQEEWEKALRDIAGITSNQEAIDSITEQIKEVAWRKTRDYKDSYLLPLWDSGVIKAAEMMNKFIETRVAEEARTELDNKKKKYYSRDLGSAYPKSVWNRIKEKMEDEIFRYIPMSTIISSVFAKLKFEK